MENKELSGVMFPNTKTNDKQPDLRGSALIGGVEYEVAAWKRTSKAGGKYLSLALQKKGERVQKQTYTHTPKQVVEQVSQAVGGVTEFKETEISSDIPF